MTWVSHSRNMFKIYGINILCGYDIGPIHWIKYWQCFSYEYETVKWLRRIRQIKTDNGKIENKRRWSWSTVCCKNQLTFKDGFQFEILEIWTTFSILVENFYFWTTFIFSIKIFIFWWKVLISAKNFDQNSQFWSKFLIFDQNFRFLIKIIGFWKNVNLKIFRRIPAEIFDFFKTNFDLKKFSIFWVKFRL